MYSPDLFRGALPLLRLGLFCTLVALIAGELSGAEPVPLTVPPLPLGPSSGPGFPDGQPVPFAQSGPIEGAAPLPLVPGAGTPLLPGPTFPGNALPGGVPPGAVLPGGPPSGSYFPSYPSPVPLSPAPLSSDCMVASPVRYWVVSSRCAPQDLCRAGCAGLQFFERSCDGCLRPTSCHAMMSQLTPGAPVMLFLHGAYVTWESNLEQADATYVWIRRVCPQRPLNIIFYTWPSDQTRVLLAPCELKKLGHQAETNAFYVASLLACLPDCYPVCLIGHSFGARMALATVQLAAGGDVQGRCLGCSIGRKRIRVVLAAAAVDHNWLNDSQRYNLAPCYAESILNLYNRQDCALKFYPLLRLFSRRALGVTGQNRIDQNRQCCPEKVQNCNVTGLIGCGHFWPNYYRSCEVARILYPWVYFPDIACQYAPVPQVWNGTTSTQPPGHDAGAVVQPTSASRGAAVLSPAVGTTATSVTPGTTSQAYAGQPSRARPRVPSITRRNVSTPTASTETEPPLRPIRAWLSGR